jgi:putative membrane protein
MIKTISMTLALALAGTALPALAQTPPPPPPPEAKMQADPYVMAAGKSDLYEINSSQIALEKSQNPALKRYAQMLITHHQKTTAATLAAAQKAGLAPPPPPALDPGATASINELQTAAPGDFDRIYLGQQVPAHQAALDLHKSYGKGGDQAPLRASAKKAAPIVQQHLTAAERMLKTGNAGHKGM